MRHVTSVFFLFSLVAVPFLTGCSNLTSTTPVASRGIPMQGRVHGGQQAVTGATIQMFAASTAGYSTASIPLLTQAVTTDTQGGFNITGDYTCPTANTQVYLLATGGNPGLAPGTNNAAISLMAALGSCGNLTPSTYIVINEVSTVASVYALAGYMTDATHVAASGTALAATGLANAFATVTNLEDLPSGNALATTPAVPGYPAASGLSANGTVPQSTINTLADILASCINTDGATTPCSTLLATATNDGTPTGTAALETTTAMLNIAHNPGVNVSTLYNLSSSTAPFQPSLSATPNDFTLSLRFTAPSFNGTYLMAVDASGDVWTPSLSGSKLTQLSPTGVVLSGVAGFTGNGLATPAMPVIDASGSVWVTNLGSTSISRFTSSGATYAGSPYTSADSDNFSGVIDSNGNFWTATEGSTVQLFSPSGALLSGSGFHLPSNNEDSVFAADTAGGIFAVGYTSAALYHLNSAGTVTTFSGGGLSHPSGVSLDQGGNMWVANFSGNSLSRFSSAGAALSPATGYTGGGLNEPVCTAVDGSGRVWAANHANGFLSEFSSTGTPLSPSIGYRTSVSTEPYQLIIDGSGNIWEPTSESSLIEYIGIATPVATPIAATNHGQRP